MGEPTTSVAVRMMARASAGKKRCGEETGMLVIASIIRLKMIYAERARRSGMSRCGHRRI
jgi:hypothetical protein